MEYREIMEDIHGKVFGLMASSREFNPKIHIILHPLTVDKIIKDSPYLSEYRYSSSTLKDILIMGHKVYRSEDVKYDEVLVCKS